MQQESLLDFIKSKYTLNEEQSNVLDCVNLKRNIFLTGSAGTGKSRVVGALKELLRDNLAVTATTGVAALNIEGITFHSYTGLGLMKMPWKQTVEKLSKNEEIKKRLLSITTLLIDEISMFSSKELVFLNHLLKSIKKTTRSFGGLQIILVGDFLQLPYVDKEDGTDHSGIEKSPLFLHNIWKELDLKVCYLSKIIRQSNQEDIKILNEIRVGEFSSKFYNSYLAPNKITSSQFNSCDNIITITDTNQKANDINSEKYNKLKGQEYIYTWEILQGTESLVRGKYRSTFERVKDILKLKVGAEIIVDYNINQQLGLVNGTRGRVIKFTNGMPTIQYSKNSEILEHTFYPHEFKEWQWNHSTNSQECVVNVKQLPISLSYAITVNRSQGLSFTESILDLNDYSKFHKGKIYTAISRCTDLSKVYYLSFPSRLKQSNGKYFNVDEDALSLLNSFKN